jgi:hypothetical protein
VTSHCGQYHIKTLPKLDDFIVNEGDIGTLGGGAVSRELDLTWTVVEIVR